MQETGKQCTALGGRSYAIEFDALESLIERDKPENMYNGAFKYTKFWLKSTVPILVTENNWIQIILQ